MGSDQSSRPYRLTEDLADALSLREGQLLRAHVVSRFSEEENKLVIDVKGHQVIARSQLDVDEGQTLLVRVESLTRPIELSLFEPSEARDALNENDLRNYLHNRNLDSSDRAVDFLETWLEESLPLGNSQFTRALDNDELFTGADPDSLRDEMWAFCFLDERGFPVDEESLELVSRINTLDGGESWTRFFSENAGALSVGDDRFDVRRSVADVGFDLINRLGKRPREASRTLHAALLKTLKGETSELSAPSSLLKSLLGQILAVALVNLENREEFLFFVPLLLGGKIELAWVGGRVKTGTAGWYLNAYLTLPGLGTVGFTGEKSPGELTVVLSAPDENVVERLRGHIGDLRSQLSKDGRSVSLTVSQEQPSTSFDAFDLMKQTSDDVQSSFARGLDLTV